MTDREPLSLDEVRKRHKHTTAGWCKDCMPKMVDHPDCDAIRLADEVEFQREHADQLFGKYVESCEEIDRLREALDKISKEEEEKCR